MGTNFTDLATTDPVTAAEINSRLEELGLAIDAVSDKVSVPVTAGENLAIRDVVFISTGQGGLTAGRAYKADADFVARSSQAFVIGFATAAISSGNSGTAQVVGVVDGFSSLTPGAPQYVSATAGALTETAPTNAWMIGIAISATEVMINSRGAQDTVAT